MTAESTSLSLVSRFGVSAKTMVPEGYYRSKLFTITTASNPLLAASAPVFSLLERLSLSATLPPIERIISNIEHELNAFHSRIHSQNFIDELLVIANYLLTATIDELVGKNYLRLNGKPAEFKAFTSQTGDVGPEKRFFEIVNYLKDKPNQYLDLIELAYYCLIAGFEGEQHLKPDGRQNLDNLIDDLYQLIQQNRVHKSLRLFKQPSAPSTQKVSKTPFAVTSLLVTVFLVAMYFTSNSLLDHKAKRILQHHIVVSKLDR